MEDFDISTNERMKLALAKPLSGEKQIVALVLPVRQVTVWMSAPVETGLEREARESEMRAMGIDPA